MANSLFEQFVSGNVELPKAPVPPRVVVYRAEHTVGSKSKKFETWSVFLGVDKKRPLAYVEMASLLEVFSVTPGGQRRRWLSRKEVSKALQADAPGRDWYWLCAEKSVPALGCTAAEAVDECINKWREKLLPYVLDEALPCPWETSTGDDNDEEEAIVAPPSHDELMAMWLASQGKQAAPAPQVLNYNLPQAAASSQPKVLKVG